MLKLKVRLESESARLPEVSRPGDAGFDLFADHEAIIGRDEVVPVGTGVSVEIPEGYVGLVCSRSGLTIKECVIVANAPGIIDSNFRGELKVLLASLDSSRVPYHVRKGDRIAQLVIVPALTPPVDIQDHLSETVRGQAGFGSSGR